MAKKIKFNGKPYKEFSYDGKKLLAILGIGIGAPAIVRKPDVQLTVKQEGRVEYNLITGREFKTADIDLSIVTYENYQIDTHITIDPNTVITGDMINKAYTETQKIIHPDKSKQSTDKIWEQLETIELELYMITEYLKNSVSSNLNTPKTSLGYTVNQVLAMLNLAFSEKYEITYYNGDYKFKTKGETRSNNNANNGLSKEQIEDNKAIINEQKKSLQQAKKKVESYYPTLI